VADNAPSSWLVDSALDALYTSVGLAVLGVNRVQVARRDLAARSARGEAPAPGDLVTRLLAAGQQLRGDPQAVREAASRLGQELQAIEELVEEVGRRLGAILDQVEPDLPDGVREVVGAARQAAADLGAHYRAVLGLGTPGDATP
jgi:hypothetical protein